MTYQTDKPVDEMRIQPSARALGDLVHSVQRGMITYDLPYQRGSVWSADQRIMLIFSVLSGTPVPALIINDRPSSMWFGPDGEELPGYAVVDGKQRMMTYRMFMEDDLAIPASWIDPEYVIETVDVGDGPYVVYSGLDRAFQRHFENKAVAVAECHVGGVRQEAAVYLRVNGSGTPQSAGDMARAARVAGE